jgi:hypothetical protein
MGNIIKEVTDNRGRNLQVKFSMGGIEGTIPFIKFIHNRKFFFGLITIPIEVGSYSNTDSPDFVLVYTEERMNRWINEGLKQLNSDNASEALKQKFRILNKQNQSYSETEVLQLLNNLKRNKMKQTAVEQFIEQLEKQGDSWENVSMGTINISIKVDDYLKLKEKAKAMEEQQKSYSEEEVKFIISEALQSALVKVDLEQWFNQFHKKK